MKRKNVLGFLMITIVIGLTFTGTAFGQDTIKPCTEPWTPYPGTDYGTGLGWGQCAECSKCPILNIPCPTTEIVDQGQERTSELYPFDFDGEAWGSPDSTPLGNWDRPEGFGSYGYCKKNFRYSIRDIGNDVEDVNRDDFRDCKFMFDICKCPEACKIEAGAKIGIQMIIDIDDNAATVDDGVYFAARPNRESLKNIYFDIRQTQLADNDCTVDNGLAFCQKDATGRAGGYPMGLGNVYRDQSGRLTPYSASDANPDDDLIARSFGGIKYYRSYVEKKKNERNYYEIAMGSEGQPLGGPVNGEIPAINRVVALQSDPNTGDYMFTEDDTARNCLLWIDIPPVRIDPTKAESLKGKTIKIRVRVLFNREGICPICIDHCECIVAIAKVCCDTATPTDQGCLFFPYVIQGQAPWGSGVVISARDQMPTAPTCTLTLTNGQGTVATYTNTAMDRLWVFLLDDVMDQFTPALPAGPATLQVTSNYRIDGYSFLTNGNFGAGTLPRACTANCAQCP
jgi:hypothetical protein